MALFSALATHGCSHGPPRPLVFSCVRNVSVPDLIVALGASGCQARGPKYFDFRISYPARRVLTFIALYIVFTTLLADNINKIITSLSRTRVYGARLPLWGSSFWRYQL